MSEWYSGLKAEDFSGKHVRVVLDGGTVIEGSLQPVREDRIGLRTGSDSDEISVLWDTPKSGWTSLGSVMSLDLVWDERDWERIDAKNLRCGDAVVANGRLYKVSWAHVGPPQVVTDTPSRMRIDLRLVSCALRRKVNVPAKPGFYKDTLGEIWARSAKSTDDGPWRSVEPDALDQPAKSDKYMANLMPLTPVHFVDGEAEEHDGSGPFEGLVQHLMSKTPASDGRAA